MLRARKPIQGRPVVLTFDDAYLDFLRAPATRKFYAALTLAIGEIIEATMIEIGRDVAARMAAVAI